MILITYMQKPTTKQEILQTVMRLVSEMVNPKSIKIWTESKLQCKWGG